MRLLVKATTNIVHLFALPCRSDSLLFASVVTRIFGRKTSMFIGGIACLFGSILNGISMNVLFLIIGRLLLGVGIGFANQDGQEVLESRREGAITKPKLKEYLDALLETISVA
ncbi:hypothetical protein CRYUN_Cryun04dG0092100 [Craigia yunnanensis]